MGRKKSSKNGAPVERADGIPIEWKEAVFDWDDPDAVELVTETIGDTRLNELRSKWSELWGQFMWDVDWKAWKTVYDGVIVVNYDEIRKVYVKWSHLDLLVKFRAALSHMNSVEEEYHRGDSGGTGFGSGMRDMRVRVRDARKAYVEALKRKDEKFNESAKHVTPRSIIQADKIEAKRGFNDIYEEVPVNLESLYDKGGVTLETEGPVDAAAPVVKPDTFNDLYDDSEDDAEAPLDYCDDKQEELAFRRLLGNGDAGGPRIDKSFSTQKRRGVAREDGPAHVRLIRDSPRLSERGSSPPTSHVSEESFAPSPQKCSQETAYEDIPPPCNRYTKTKAFVESNRKKTSETLIARVREVARDAMSYYWCVEVYKKGFRSAFFDQFLQQEMKIRRNFGLEAAHVSLYKPPFQGSPTGIPRTFKEEREWGRMNTPYIRVHLLYSSPKGLQDVVDSLNCLEYRKSLEGSVEEDGQGKAVDKSPFDACKNVRVLINDEISKRRVRPTETLVKQCLAKGEIVLENQFHCGPWAKRGFDTLRMDNDVGRRGNIRLDKNEVSHLVIMSSSYDEAIRLIEYHNPSLLSCGTYMKWVETRKPPRNRKVIVRHLLPHLKKPPPALLKAIRDGRVPILSGPSGVGKTYLVQAWFPEYQFLDHPEGLAFFSVKCHEGIILDELNPTKDTWPIQKMLCFLDPLNSRDYRVLYKCVRVPPDVPRIITTNLSKEDLLDAFISQMINSQGLNVHQLNALMRRLYFVDVSVPTYDTYAITGVTDLKELKLGEMQDRLARDENIEDCLGPVENMVKEALLKRGLWNEETGLVKGPAWGKRRGGHGGAASADFGRKQVMVEHARSVESLLKVPMASPPTPFPVGEGFLNSDEDDPALWDSVSHCNKKKRALVETKESTAFKSLKKFDELAAMHPLLPKANKSSKMNKGGLTYARSTVSVFGYRPNFGNVPGIPRSTAEFRFPIIDDPWDYHKIALGVGVVDKTASVGSWVARSKAGSAPKNPKSGNKASSSIVAVGGGHGLADAPLKGGSTAILGLSVSVSGKPNPVGWQ